MKATLNPLGDTELKITLMTDGHLIEVPEFGYLMLAHQDEEWRALLFRPYDGTKSWQDVVVKDDHLEIELAHRNRHVKVYISELSE